MEKRRLMKKMKNFVDESNIDREDRQWLTDRVLEVDRDRLEILLFFSPREKTMSKRKESFLLHIPLKKLFEKRIFGSLHFDCSNSNR